MDHNENFEAFLSQCPWKRGYVFANNCISDNNVRKTILGITAIF